MVEADALGGEPPAQLGQPLLAVHAEEDPAVLLAHVPSEARQAFEDRRSDAVEAQLHLEVAVRGTGFVQSASMTPDPISPASVSTVTRTEVITMRKFAA